MLQTSFLTRKQDCYRTGYKPKLDEERRYRHGTGTTDNLLFWAASESAVIVPSRAHERTAETNALERVLTTLIFVGERMKGMKLSQKGLLKTSACEALVAATCSAQCSVLTPLKNKLRGALDWPGLRNHQAPLPAMELLDGLCLNNIKMRCNAHNCHLSRKPHCPHKTAANPNAKSLGQLNIGLPIQGLSTVLIHLSSQAQACEDRCTRTVLNRHCETPYNKLDDTWWAVTPTLLFVVQRALDTFKNS